MERFARVRLRPQPFLRAFSDAPGNKLGTVFTFWDKLRGTLDLAHYSEERELGNGELDYPENWFRQFFRPLSRIMSPRVMPSR